MVDTYKINNTLADLIANIKDPDDYWIELGDFLDNLKTLSKEEISAAFVEEPEFSRYSDRNKAFFAASANKLCHDYEVETPAWTYNKEYFLDEPWFSMDAKGELRLILLAESPKEFRIRGMFFSNNILSRM